MKLLICFANDGIQSYANRKHSASMCIYTTGYLQLYYIKHWLVWLNITITIFFSLVSVSISVRVFAMDLLIVVNPCLDLTINHS